MIAITALMSETTAIGSQRRQNAHERGAFAALIDDASEATGPLQHMPGRFAARTTAADHDGTRGPATTERDDGHDGDARRHDAPSGATIEPGAVAVPVGVTARSTDAPAAVARAVADADWSKASDDHVASAPERDHPTDAAISPVATAPLVGAMRVADVEVAVGVPAFDAAAREPTPAGADGAGADALPARTTAVVERASEGTAPTASRTAAKRGAADDVAARDPAATETTQPAAPSDDRQSVNGETRPHTTRKAHGHDATDPVATRGNGIAIAAGAPPSVAVGTAAIVADPAHRGEPLTRSIDTATRRVASGLSRGDRAVSRPDATPRADLGTSASVLPRGAVPDAETSSVAPPGDTPFTVPNLRTGQVAMRGSATRTASAALARTLDPPESSTTPPLPIAIGSLGVRRSARDASSLSGEGPLTKPLLASTAAGEGIRRTTPVAADTDASSNLPGTATLVTVQPRSVATPGDHARSEERMAVSQPPLAQATAEPEATRALPVSAHPHGLAAGLTVLAGQAAAPAMTNATPPSATTVSATGIAAATASAMPLPLELDRPRGAWVADLARDLADLSAVGERTAKFRLRPASLGAIDVTLEFAAGRAHAAIIAETARAHGLLAAAADDLGTALASATATPAGVSVSFGASDRGGAGTSGHSASGSRDQETARPAFGDVDVRVAEPVARPAPIVHRGSVNVYA